MITKDFDALTEEIFNKIRDIAQKKGHEYASSNTDRLANFKRGGANQGLPPESILMVYAAKHWDSINTLMKDLRQYVDDTQKAVLEGQQFPTPMHRLRELSSEPVEGRLLDMITYMILLWGLLQDRELQESRDAKLPPESIE